MEIVPCTGASFSSTDPSIAEHYRQGRGKVNYVTEFGVLPYFDKSMKVDLQN